MEQLRYVIEDSTIAELLGVQNFFQSSSGLYLKITGDLSDNIFFPKSNISFIFFPLSNAEYT